MQKWEYLTETFHLHLDTGKMKWSSGLTSVWMEAGPESDTTILDVVAGLGKLGWEMVSMTVISQTPNEAGVLIANGFAYVFKRPIEG